MGRKAAKILHTSDLHLGMNGTEEIRCLAAISQTATEQDVDLLIIAGDLFDHNRISEELVKQVAGKLQDIGCAVVILAGNHDCLTPGSVLNRDGIWSRCDHLKIFSDTNGETFEFPELGISLWGKSITTDVDDVRPLEGIPNPCARDRWNIAVAHGFYVDRYPALFPSYHIAEEEVSGLTWDYIALGHVPVFRCISKKPMVYYSGSPTLSKTSALVELSEDRGVVVTRCEVCY